MFVIRARQLPTLQHDALAGLVERIADFIRSHVDANGTAPAEDSLRALVVEGVSLGLRSERELALFVTAGHLLGPGFTEPGCAVTELLSEPGLSPLERAQRLGALVDEVSDRGPRLGVD